MCIAHIRPKCTQYIMNLQKTTLIFIHSYVLQSWIMTIVLMFYYSVFSAPIIKKTADAYVAICCISQKHAKSIAGIAGKETRTEMHEWAVKTTATEIPNIPNGNDDNCKNRIHKEINIQIKIKKTDITLSKVYTIWSKILPPWSTPPTDSILGIG